MLQLISKYLDQSVLSLRTGGEVATTVVPIINPNNLKIEGFYCDDKFEKIQLVLLAQDIRDHVDRGFVINDHEVMVPPEDLVRLKKVLELQFELINKPVITVNGHKLGKINDYAVDDTSMYIQKMYVGQSLLKSISGGNLSVDRSQIVEITDQKVVIQDPLKGVKDITTANAPAAAS